MRAVRVAPINMKRTFEPKPPPSGKMDVNISRAPTLSIWPLSKFKPMNSKAKPIIMLAACLGNRRSIKSSGTAKPAMGSAKSPSENPPKDRTINHAVMVVPMFAPNRTPIDSRIVRSPALTRLTKVTVTAELDCNKLVTNTPVIVPTQVLCVMLDRNSRKDVAETRRMASLIVRMPNRNTPSPPNTLSSHLIQIMNGQDKRRAPLGRPSCQVIVFLSITGKAHQTPRGRPGGRPWWWNRRRSNPLGMGSHL